MGDPLRFKGFIENAYTPHEEICNPHVNELVTIDGLNVAIEQFEEVMEMGGRDICLKVSYEVLNVEGNRSLRTFLMPVWKLAEVFEFVRQVVE